jgi:RNA polymerase sigma-70 factor (ECF subfamily)
METSLSLLDRLVGAPGEADWRQLLDLYQPLLRAWAVRGGVAGADADDLIQEVLLVVFREVGGFERRGPGAFRAWLRAILARRVRDHFRGRTRRPTAAGGGAAWQLDELESPHSELSRLWDREHDEHVAAGLLRRIRPDFATGTWQAFVRHVLEGEPADRVAAELALSVNSVLLAKSRILKRLREELAGLVD